MIFHNKDLKEIFRELGTSEKGLTDEEVNRRIERYGLNEIKEKKKASPIKIFFSQFNNFIVYILIAALVISFLLDEKIDAIVIGIILVINAVLGFIQEYKAEKAIEALKKMASLKASVIRDGNEKEVEAVNVVPGDIILLETGDKIPADARLIEVFNLQTQEAALTGESLPIKKEIRVLAENAQIADQKNMVFSGTVVTNGRGKAVVVKTGMNSEIGRIAKLIQETESEETPLQKKLSVLGKWLGILVIIICLVVFASATLEGGNMLEMFIVAVSLAVAAIPEGLPAVVTISLALGVRRMVKTNALIRKLPSVETLGSVTVICSDKTGTLTCNEMTVKKVFANNKVIDVSGSGYDAKGDFIFDNKKVDKKEIELLLKIGALNNDATLKEGEIMGDPTEGALIVSAAKLGLIKGELEIRYKRIDEIGFSSERKMMSTIHKEGNKKIIYLKGAPEIILNSCNKIIINNKIRKLSKKDKDEILKKNKVFAEKALRVLGFAYKEVKGKASENDLIFVGLQGMIDPPRTEVKQAIEKCKTAGIKVIMITGDHEITAKAIAKELGLDGKSINGNELDKLTNLEKIVEEVVVFARVNPEHKIRIVDALRKKGHIVAMTGDGVNDAPALKKADIGIAMGITGTDVAKEASHMILTDDNFASIVNAIEEGRGIFDNIRKFVEYLLSSNLGEVLTIFIAILIGFGAEDGKALLPLIAIQLLWINLVTDGLPALALGVEPKEKGIMLRPPRNPKEKILPKSTAFRMAFIGIIMMLGTLGIFYFYNNKYFELKYARTVAFSTLVFYQLFNVLNTRSEKDSLFKIGFFSNKKLIYAILISVALQVLVIHTPLNAYFKTVPITLIDWFYIILVSSTVLIFGEVFKLVKRVKQTA